MTEFLSVLLADKLAMWLFGSMVVMAFFTLSCQMALWISGSYVRLLKARISELKVLLEEANLCAGCGDEFETPAICRDCKPNRAVVLELVRPPEQT